MIYILIPTYNEAENLKLMLINIDKHLKEKKRVIIADDGSTDNTIQLIAGLEEKFAVERVGYKNNRGAGYAFKNGFNFLIPKLKENDLVITMEGDNTTDYQIINKMLAKTDKNTVVLASPHAKGGKFIGVNSIRVMLSKVSAYLDSIIFGISGIKTYSSFYRIYPAQCLKKLKRTYGKNFISNNGFSAGIEILIKLNKVQTNFIEIPSIVDWTKRKGKSKMNIFKNITNHLTLYKNYYSGKFG